MEVKFRAWDTEGEYMKFGGMAILNSDGTLFTDGKSIVMQFTGLKDKNGVEIFEGDVVKWKQAEGGILSPDENTYICQIKWLRTGWVCEDINPIKDDYHSCFTLSSSHMEIIGNIYQNPELKPS